MQKVLALSFAVALLAGAAQAQTRPAARPGTTPAKRPVATPHKPVAKPTAKPTTAPAARPQVVVSTPVARPVAATPAAAAPLPAAAHHAAVGGLLFQKGSNAVNLGMGFGLGHGLVSSATSLPALSASYMRGVAAAGPGTISVGGLVGYKSYSWAYGGGEKAAWRHLFVGARGAYHYSFNNPKLDTYAGVGLGLHTAFYSAGQGASTQSDGSQLELSGLVGARYFFTNTLGAFAELGYDMSLLKVGASARF